jgi:hypothetical protein
MNVTSVPAAASRPPKYPPTPPLPRIAIRIAPRSYHAHLDPTRVWRDHLRVPPRRSVICADPFALRLQHLVAAVQPRWDPSQTRRDYFTTVNETSILMTSPLTLSVAAMYSVVCPSFMMRLSTDLNERNMGTSVLSTPSVV